MKHIQMVISFMLTVTMVIGMTPLTVVRAEEMKDAVETTAIWVAENETEETEAEETVPSVTVTIEETISKELIEEITTSAEVANALASGTCGENLSWDFDAESGVLTISGTGEMAMSSSDGWTYRDYSTQIKKVVLTPGVTSIGHSAFRGCGNLTNVTIPNSVTIIDYSAFYDCSSLTSVVIPEGVTSIDGFAFFNCSSLIDVVIPESVTSIEYGVFSGCSSLSNVVIPEGVTSIEDQTFLYCEKLTNIVMPKSITNIGNLAFGGCSSLTDIVIPGGVSSIGNYAFYNCSSLTDIMIPKGVTSIGSCPFTECTALKQILVEEENAYYCNDDAGGLFTKNMTTLIQIPCGISNIYTVPDCVTSIAEFAFENCISLTGVIIPESIATINLGAFAGCSSLTSIYFEGDAPEFGEDIFYGVTATAYYHADNSTWTDAIRQNYGGSMVWEPHPCTIEHTRVVDDAVLPTCTETGLTEGSHCSCCNEILIAQKVIPALGHTEAIDPASAPTCTGIGMTEGKHCEVCHMVLVAREEIPALGHTEVVDIAVTPTCTETGLTEGSHCETCGEIFTVQEVIPATGHSFEEGSCLICGALDKADHTLAAGKSLTLKAIDPETGKAYTSKQIKWSMDPACAPYASISAKGKLTAKKVVEKVRVEAIGTILGDEEAQVIVTADIYPAVTQVEIFNGMEMVNGKTVPVDTSEEVTLPNLTAKVYPTDAMADVTWKSSSRKIAEIDPVTGELTWKGRNGTVTITATAKDGSKKKATVKLTFGTLAEGLTIGIKDKKQIIAAEEADVISGKSFQLAAELTGNPTNKKVTWSLENTADSAYVKLSSGKVTAKTVYEERTVVIRATAADGSGMTDTFTVNVKPRDAGILILKQDGKNVTKSTVYADRNKGGTVELTAHNLTGGETPDVEWRSSRTAIATVANGVVTFLKAGTVTITATDVNDGRKAAVTVKAVQLASKVTITGAAEVASGKSITLKADCEDGAGSKVTWTIVKGAEYAKLSSKGKLTANKDITSAKEVTVRATAADGSGVESEPVTVTIRPLAQGVQIYSEEGGRTLFSVRSSESLWVRSNTILEWAKNECGPLQLSARVYPYYHNEPSRNAIQDVDWKSSSSKIASVDEDGLVTCHKAGTVTITATAGDGSGRKVSFKLKVINKIESLSMEDQRVKGGKSIDLAKKLEIDPTGATYKTFTWEITGGNGAAYASINAKGVLKAKKVTGPMDVEVRATAQDGSGKSAEFTVTITP